MAEPRPPRRYVLVPRAGTRHGDPIRRFSLARVAEKARLERLEQVAERG
jgi:hypothetical protein